MPTLKTPRILWGALAASVVIEYVALRTITLPPAQPISPVMVPALGVMAVGIAAVSFVLPRNFIRQAIARRSFETRDEAATDGRDGSYRSTRTHRRVFAAPAEVRRAAFMLYQTPLILSLALSNAVALFGFVLGFLGAPMQIASLFFAAGLVLILIRFPTRDRVLGPIEKKFGATLD